jgi:hypothetical protein
MNVAEKSARRRYRPRAAFAPIESELLEGLSARAERENAVRKSLTENHVPSRRTMLKHWTTRLGPDAAASFSARLGSDPLPRLLWRGL